MSRTRQLGALVAIALATGASVASISSDALGRAEPTAPKQGCAVDGVRVFLYDQGDASTVEISTRLQPIGGLRATCTVDWSRVTLASPDQAAGTPTVAIVQSYVDHALEAPLMLADGLSSAIVPAWKGDVDERGKIVSLRLVVEGTASGLRVEVPRDTFPRATTNGARAERRAKGARDGTARFGALGELAIKAEGPGPANAFGPTDPLGEASIVVETVPGGAPLTQPIPATIAVLGMMRATIPLRVLELSPENDAGWDEAARYAYAAAMNGDPLVASLGVHTLAWLGSGLSLQAVRIATISDGPETAAVPAAVATAVGDPDARVAKTLGGIGRFLPLGRPSTFKKALMKRPELDLARAKAARDAVARLAPVKPEELVQLAVPALLDRTVPVDPPAPMPKPGAAPIVTPQPTEPAVEPADAPPASARPRHHRRRAHRHLPIGLLFGGLAAFAAIALAWNESRERTPAA
jgi:hypothetical protein